MLSPANQLLTALADPTTSSGEDPHVSMGHASGLGILRGKVRRGVRKTAEDTQLIGAGVSAISICLFNVQSNDPGNWLRLLQHIAQVQSQHLSWISGYISANSLSGCHGQFGANC